MPPNNPYIEKVLSDKDILTKREDILPWQWKWKTYFQNENDIILEIGTGMGNFFWKQVSSYPDKNFIWMEIRYKRLFQTAEKSRDSCIRRNDDINNFVMLKEFGQNIHEIFWEEEIFETYIFFPDPWANKDRQRKHRLLQSDFLENLYTITKKWWKVFFKTDHQEYFESTKSIIQEQWLWSIEVWTDNYEQSDIFDMNNITEFEWFYRGEKTNICYLELVK